MSHQFDFLLRLRFPLGPEESVRRPHTDVISREFLRITKRKIRGNSRRSYTAFFEKMGKNFFVLWRSLLRSLYFALKLTEHHEFIRFGLFSAAIDFQITQDQCALTVALEKNKWIGGPELGGVQDIGIGIAGCYDQARGFILSCAHCSCIFLGKATGATGH